MPWFKVELTRTWTRVDRAEVYVNAETDVKASDKAESMGEDPRFKGWNEAETFDTEVETADIREADTDEIPVEFRS